MTTEKRVAITGLGVVSPLGNDVKSTWTSLQEGKSGASRIARFDSSLFSVQIAAEVKNLTIEKFLSTKEMRKMGLFIQYGLIAAKEALSDAGFSSTEKFSDQQAPRIGVNVSAGMGGLPEIQYWDRELLSKEKKVVSPFFVPMIIPNLISGHISMMFNAQGPNTCIATACATSSHSIGEAFRFIQQGKADIMITGGAEAVICELGISGFASMKALSTRNDAPEKASRPYDKDRDGFLLGEGAAVLILESLEHAQKRGAKIYGEILGYGLNADAYHITSPAPEGRGAQTCMRLALSDAKLNPEQIDYINSHGTSTPTGDVLEAQAIAHVFEKNKKSLNISSTKSMTGHLLGAAGALEAVFCILALKDGVIPATLNLDNLDPELEKLGLNFTPHTAIQKKIKYALSNSFGFGGTNGSLVLGAL